MEHSDNSGIELSENNGTAGTYDPLIGCQTLWLHSPAFFAIGEAGEASGCDSSEAPRKRLVAGENDKPLAESHLFPGAYDKTLTYRPHENNPRCHPAPRLPTARLRPRA